MTMRWKFLRNCGKGRRIMRVCVRNRSLPMKRLPMIAILILTAGCSTFLDSHSERPETEIVVHAPIDVVWEKALEILPNERMILVSTDKDEYLISAEKKGSTLKHTRALINLKLLTIGKNETLVKLWAQNVGLAGFGHQGRVIRNFSEKLKGVCEEYTGREEQQPGEGKVVTVETPQGTPKTPAFEPRSPETSATPDLKEVITHEEIQWLVLKLGSDIGMDLWIPRSHRDRVYQGKRLGDFKRLRDSVSSQFDEATNRAMEYMDALWLNGNLVVAGFEVEHASPPYYGLLRMARVVSIEPDFAVPLYVVAPDEERRNLTEEINRPIFAELRQICEYIPYSVLKEQSEKGIGSINYLKPDFLGDLSEPCSPR